MTTPEDLYERLVKAGSNWADLNSAAELLEESKRSVRSQYAMEHLQKAGAIGKAEIAADADARYREHIAIMVAARKKANLAKVLYEGAKTYIDLYRSQQASERAAMNLR